MRSLNLVQIMLFYSCWSFNRGTTCVGPTMASAAVASAAGQHTYTAVGLMKSALIIVKTWHCCGGGFGGGYVLSVKTWPLAAISTAEALAEFFNGKNAARLCPRLW